MNGICVTVGTSFRRRLGISFGFAVRTHWAINKRVKVSVVNSVVRIPIVTVSAKP
ncbi:hypothetical protein D9M69_713670 [compost metagenome]